MALGIGATTAIYSVIDATLLHPLPYPNPSQLVRIVDDLPGVGAQGVGISVPEWRDLGSSGIFQSASITGTGANVNLTGSAQPLRLSFKQVTPNYFALLGVDAQLGRTFDPHDTTPGYNLEVVISDGLWRREFGADPHIIGKALRLDNDVYHVVGVMPRGFRDQGSTSDEQNVELWLGAGFAGVPFPPPLRESRLRSRVVIARLKPGLSIAAAQRHLDALVESLKKQYPAEYPVQTEWTVRLVPLSQTVVGSVRQSLILLFGAVGLVLLISCVNVANSCSPGPVCGVVRSRFARPWERKEHASSASFSPKVCCSSCWAELLDLPFSSAPSISCCSLFRRASRTSMPFPSIGACWPSLSPSLSQPESSLALLPRGSSAASI